MGILDRFSKSSTVDPFDAITERIDVAYPNAESRFFEGVEARIHALHGFVVVHCPDPVPHWLIVSQGFTELWEKEGDDPKVSGWGFELSCRVPAIEREHDFIWVFHWMQNIVDRLEDSRSFLDPGHTMNMVEPENEKTICHLVFAKDFQLRPTKSKHGKFYFLQMIGLNSAESRAIRLWNSASFVKLLREHDPLTLIDEQQPGILENKSFVRKIQEGQARDGSSAGMALCDILWFENGDEIQIHMSRSDMDTIEEALLGRLAHNMPMILQGDQAKANSLVVLESSNDQSRIEKRGGVTAAMVCLDVDGQKVLTEIMLAARSASGRGKWTLRQNVSIFVVDQADFDDKRYPF